MFAGTDFGPESARQTMAVNVLGARRVTEALLPALKRAASTHEFARIINVCSSLGRLNQVSGALQSSFVAAAESPLPASALQLAEAYCTAVEDGSYAAKGWPRRSYDVSKLCELAYTFSTARALAGEGIDVQVGRVYDWTRSVPFLQIIVISCIAFGTHELDCSD